MFATVFNAISCYHPAMAARSYGAGTIFQRGQIWYVSFWAGGRQIQKSSGSTKRQDAVRLRDQLLGKKARGEIGTAASDKVTCGELLDDLLEHARHNVKASTEKIWKLIVEANLRPFFGHRKAGNLSTAVLKEYRRKRVAQGRSESTCNRELSMLRIAFNLGRRCTPPKVLMVPYFPMVAETQVRQGFLTDEQYELLRDALPDYLRPLFVTGYFTGMRLGELLALRWHQVDWDQGFITLSSGETKTGHSRAVPVLDGDMRHWLEWAHKNADGCDAVFHHGAVPIREFRFTWRKACMAAGVPDLKFHDLRRTAVRNMRRAGVPQVVRMRISGHRTDSMERRYNIV
ncbi:MAG TPA: site-specific integrase, partial [Terracidiphilus sp.]|nr:site-specific integrase [Terracidiphilus sp.]